MVFYLLQKANNESMFPFLQIPVLMGLMVVATGFLENEESKLVARKKGLFQHCWGEPSVC